MIDMLLDTLLDTLKSLPVLFLVYCCIELIQQRLNPQKLVKYKNTLLGPPIGALAGCIPQCGFSAASASLYNSGVIGAGTLIAVFLATSDEAIPIMLSQAADLKLMLALIFSKIIIATASGYFFMFTVFRKERQSILENPPLPKSSCCKECEHHSHRFSVLSHAASHTLKTTGFICGVLLLINLVILLIGDQNLQTVLLTNSPLQPLLTALIGLVPGCATSVLLVELLLNGSISFAAAAAGLSTGAGFGFLVLFKGVSNPKNGLKILSCTYLAGAAFGMLLQLFDLIF